MATKKTEEKTLMNVGMCMNCAHWGRRDTQPLLEMGKSSILGNCKGMMSAVIGLDNINELMAQQSVEPGNEQIAGENQLTPKIVTGHVMTRKSKEEALAEKEAPAVILRTRKMPLQFTAQVFAIVTAHEFGCVNFVPKHEGTVTTANAVSIAN